MKKVSFLLMALLGLSMQAEAQYCTPTYTEACSSDDFIDNFTFNTISNLGSGCNGNADNYVFNSAMGTSVTIGGTYNISMQAGQDYEQGFGVWIDFNGDQDFTDAGEFVYASPSADITTFSGTVTVPASAIPGVTRMRVRCEYSATVDATEYCTEFEYGETEDYPITILPGAPHDVAVSSILSPGNMICGSSATAIQVQVANAGSVSESDIPVKVLITGSTTLTLNDTLDGPLNSGQTATLTFGTTLNTVAGGTYNIVAFTNLSTDPNAANDTSKVNITINSIPAAPTAQGDTICSNNSVTLTASGTDVVKWYDALTAGSLLYTGSSFTTPVLNNTTTYYVQTQNINNGAMTSMFASNNGASGNMFNVTAINTLTIDSFEVNSPTLGASTFRVYYKTGSYIGAENDSTLWTFLGTQVVNGMGDDQPTRLSVGGLTIPTGQQYALYIVSPDGGINYTDGVNSFSDGNITFGSGNGNSWPFSGNNTPRTWNGTIYYTAAGCASERTAVTVLVNNPTVTYATPAAVCSNEAAFNLSGASPAGGTYSGMGVSAGSFDPSVAGAGSHTITYIYSLGTGCADTATVSQVVNAAPTVNLGNDTLVCPNNIITLDAGAGFTGYLWSTSETTAQISVPSIAGTYTVTVTNSFNCTASDAIYVDFCMGINEANSNIVKVAPNPSTGLFNVMIDGEFNELSLEVLDVQGRILHTESYNNVKGQITGMIDLSAYANGIYYLKMNNGSEVKVERLLIQK